MDDVVIVGAGVIGLSTARELAGAGLRVRILERGLPGKEASWAGAGMIPPSIPGGGALARELAQRSRLLWPQLSADLFNETGVDNEYWTCGSLIFPTTCESLPELQQCWTGLDVPSESWSANAIQRHEPGVSTEAGAALWLPTAAQVRNPRHLQALLAACRQRHVTIESDTQVVGWDSVGDRVSSARTQRGPIHAGQFIVTAGAWSDVLLRELAAPCGVTPIRGQMLLYAPLQRPLSRIIEVGARYLTPRRDGRLLVGSTEEHAAFEKVTTSEGLGDLQAFAEACVPELARQPIESSWAGLRPWRRRDPWVGQAPGWTNVWVATGHFRSGLSSSPATSERLGSLILQPSLTAARQSASPDTKR